MVGGGAVGENAGRTEQVVVESKIPALGDILCMCDMNLIVFVERTMVSEYGIGFLRLIEVDVDGRFVKFGEYVGAIGKAWRTVESEECGKMRMPQLGDTQIVVAVEPVELVAELGSSGREFGMLIVHSLHLQW